MLRFSHPLHLVLGLIIWSAWFVVLYGGLSVACAVAPPETHDGALTWLNGLVLAGAVMVAGGLLWAGWRCWCAVSGQAADREQCFISRVGGAVYLLSALASLVLVVPGTVLPPCL